MNPSPLTQVTILALLLALPTLLAPSTLGADLGDLKAEVEAAEAENQDAEEEDESPEEVEDDEGSDAAAEFFFAVMRLLFLINSEVRYGDHPYAEDSPRGWILYPPWSPSDEEDPSWVDPARPGQIAALRIRADGGRQFDLGWRGRIQVDGKVLGILGPAIEVGTYVNKPTMEPREWLTQTRLGGNLSLIQTDPLSMDFVIQYLAWSGILDRQGAAVGFILRGFPGAGLEWEARWTALSFEHLSVQEYEVALAKGLGGSAQIRAGWTWWTGDLSVKQGPWLGFSWYL